MDNTVVFILLWFAILLIIVLALKITYDYFIKTDERVRNYRRGRGWFPDI